MSNRSSHEDLVREVMQAVAAFQDGTDHVDEAASARLGVNRTDLRCLALIARAGRLTAGGLASAANLSPAAATTAIDRLERAGYARRVRDDVDRRRVMVEATPEARERTAEIWDPIGRDSHHRLSDRSDEQLRTILAFLEEGQRLQAEHAVRIRRGGG